MAAISNQERMRHSSLIERMATAAANEAARLDSSRFPWALMDEDRRELCRLITLRAFVAGCDATQGETIEALLIACERK